MRNLVIVMVLVLCFSALTVAQELPKFEVFGGWSYLRADGGGSNMSPTNGWNTSVTFNVNETVGIVVDASGNYRSFEDPGIENYLVYEEQDVLDGETGEPTGETVTVTSAAQRAATMRSGARSLSLAFGPRFKMRDNETYQPFYHAMLGLRHSSYDDFIQYTDFSAYTADEISTYFGAAAKPQTWISSVTDNFIMMFGGGLDIVINERFSVRAFQADYVLERVEGDFTPDLRFATGLVFNLSQK